MKPRKRHPCKLITRIRPGRVIRFPPRFLHGMGWVVGTPLIVELAATGDLVVFKKPTALDWQIERLEKRIRGVPVDVDDCRPRTWIEFMKLGRFRFTLRKTSATRHQ